MRRVRNGKEEGKKRERRSNADNNNIGRMEQRKSKTKKSNNMDYDSGFIMQKTVDWSLLNDGMTIPVSACALLKPPTTTASSTNNPHFNRKKFQFEFANGEVLKLKLYEHLKI